MKRQAPEISATSFSDADFYFRDIQSDSVLDGLRKPGDPDELSLTLDVGLQPALEVSESLRRQADSIFEKEQEYLLEAANKQPKKRKPELYVTDHG